MRCYDSCLPLHSDHEGCFWIFLFHLFFIFMQQIDEDWGYVLMWVICFCMCVYAGVKCFIINRLCHSGKVLCRLGSRVHCHLLPLNSSVRRGFFTATVIVVHNSLWINGTKKKKAQLRRKFFFFFKKGVVCIQDVVNNVLKFQFNLIKQSFPMK